MRRIAVFVVAMWASWMFSAPAMAEKRVALVIGNSVYENAARSPTRQTMRRP